MESQNHYSEKSADELRILLMRCQKYEPEAVFPTI